MPAPPLPANALSFPNVHHMLPELFLCLVFDVVEALAGMSDREVMIAELRAKIEAGTYNPSSSDIVDGMVRRSIADRMR